MVCVECKQEAAKSPSAAPPLDRGVPGASAERQAHRRKRNREERTLAAHPHIGRFLLRWRDAPQHETAWLSGARGEREVAESLERHTADGPAILLHDRRVPGERGNIDHIAIAPAGVFVIDAKNHSRRVEVTKPLFGQPTLWVDGRRRTKLIDGLDRQVAAVSAALTSAEVPVRGALCFVRAEFPLFSKQEIRGHVLLHPRRLAKLLNADGPLQPPAIETLAVTLATALPAA